MKRLRILSIFFIVIILSGCSKKELKCSMVDNTIDGILYTQTIVANYSNDELTLIEIDLNIDVTQNYHDYLSAIEDNTAYQFTDFEGKKGIDVEKIKKDNNVSYHMKIDINEINNDTKTLLSIINNSEDYEEAKAFFKEEGYTCK